MRAQFYFHEPFMFNLHGYGPSILEGTLLSLEVSLASLVIAMLLGICGALSKLSNSLPLRFVAQIYTTIIRGIPDLVLMLLVVFTLMGMDVSWLYILLVLPWIFIAPWMGNMIERRTIKAVDRLVRGMAQSK